MKKILTALIFLTSLPVLAVGNIISTTTFIDKDSYKDEKDFNAIRISKLDNNKIIFNLCEYKRTEGKFKKDCSLSIGNSDGFSESVAKEKLFDYKEDRKQEYITSAALAASVIVIGALRWRSIRAYQVARFKNGKSFFSGLGDDYLYNFNLPAMRLSHITSYSLSLVTLLVGKIWLLDDAGENEKDLKDAYRLNDNSENTILLIKDLDVDKLADKLSRAL